MKMMKLAVQYDQYHHYVQPFVDLKKKNPIILHFADFDCCPDVVIVGLERKERQYLVDQKLVGVGVKTNQPRRQNNSRK